MVDHGNTVGSPPILYRGDPVTTDAKAEASVYRRGQHAGSYLPQKKHMDFASYVSGFVDGEGCFSVSFNLRAKLKTGIEVRPSFSIGQNERSLKLLRAIEQFFGCGSIRYSSRDACYRYETRDIRELMRKILPHFEKFPLQSDKAKDFKIFRDICERMTMAKHLNPKHLRQIIHLAYRMNGSGKRKYTEAELLRVLDKMKI